MAKLNKKSVSKSSEVAKSGVNKKAGNAGVKNNLTKAAKNVKVTPVLDISNVSTPAKTLKRKQKVPLPISEDEKVIVESKVDDKVEGKLNESDVIYTSADIFIGNLPIKTTVTSLKSKFAVFGNVLTVNILNNNLKKTSIVKNEPNLNAYLKFDNANSAKKSTELNGTKIGSHNIRVVLKKNLNAKFDPKCTLVLKKLAKSATDQRIYELFSDCGKIDYVRTLYSPEGFKGTAFLVFKSPESAQKALKKNETIFEGRPISIAHLKENKSKPSENKKAVKSGKKDNKKKPTKVVK